MGILKDNSIHTLSVFMVLAGLLACGDSATRVVSVPITSDTYIVSGSEAMHGAEEILQIGGGATLTHALLPLPSVDGEVGKESFVEAIVRAIFIDGFFNSGCDTSKILLPEYLTSVKLELTPITSTDASLATQFTLRALGRGWWQGATWTRAHPFLSSGVWSAAGGDLLGGVSSVAGVQSGNSVSFEVKDLVAESATTTYEWGRVPAIHGFRIESSSGTAVNFHSAQSAWGTGYTPEMVFTYTGPCVPPPASGTN